MQPPAFVCALAPLGCFVGMAMCRPRTTGKKILVRLISLGICFYAGLVVLFLSLNVIHCH